MTEENIQESTMTSEAPSEEAQTEAPVELTVNDLSALRQVIDVAQSRGAFKTNEMVAVGSVYNKLDSFLNAVAAQQQAQQAQPESGEQNA